jgi:hypothetical protein
VVFVKSSFFWDITQCGLLNVNRRCGGRYRLHLQGRRISQTRNQHEAGSRQSSRLAYYLTLKMEVKCSSETSVDFQRLHVVISQKMELVEVMFE